MVINSNNPELDDLESQSLPSPEGSEMIDLRLDMVSDLEKKSLEDGLSSGTTEERLALYQEILSNEDLDEAQRVHEILQGSLDLINKTSVDALQALTEASGFAAAYLLAKHQANSPSIHTLGELVQLSSHADTPVRSQLGKTWTLLASNPKSKLSKLFQEDFLPELINESNALAKSTLDHLAFYKSAPGKATGWVKDQYEKHPAAVGSLAVAGAIGLGALIYRTMRRDRVPQSIVTHPESKNFEHPEPIETGQGTSNGILDTAASAVRRTGSAIKFLPTALFMGGGAILSGMILGTDQTQSFLEKKLTGNMSFIPKMLYESRLPATFIHVCSGRGLDALGTLSYGGRDTKAKMRHEIYAKFFEINDKEIWAISGVSLQDLLDSDPSREFPLSSGMLKYVPVINTMIAKTGLVAVEEKIKKRFLDVMDVLTLKDPSIKSKSVDEALRIAFAEGVFDTLDEEIQDGENPESEAIVSELEDYDVRLDNLIDGPKLESMDIQSLREEGAALYKELNELRLAMPGDFAELKKAFSAAFPIPLISEAVDYSHDVDLIAAQDFYEQFANTVESEETSAIVTDLETVAAAQKFFADLKVGQTPNDELHAQIESMKLINKRMTTWKFRAEQSRKNAAQIDAEEFNRGDIAELATFYWIGYTSTLHGLQWSVKTVVNPDTGVKEKIVALASGVGIIALGANTGMAAYQLKNGKILHAGFRLLVPGPQLGYETLTFHRNFGHIIGLNTPKVLLEKVARGQMSPSEASRLSSIAMRNADKFKNPAWVAKMRQFRELSEILDSNSDEVLRFVDDPSIARGIDASVDAGTHKWAWQKSLRTLVKEIYGEAETLESFFARMKTEKASRLSNILTPVRIARMIDSMTDRLNLRRIPFEELVQLLAKGGPVRTFLMTGLSRAAKYGLPPGALLLMAYYACEVVQTGDKNKAQKFARLGTGLIAAELSIQGAIAIKNTAHGAALASRFSKHPYAIGILAILGLVGLSYKAEEMAEPYMKSTNGAVMFTTNAIGTAAYAGTGGHIVDLAHHYGTVQEEKEYFMRTTSLPFLGERHMAFRDGTIGYSEEMDPESAITVYNYRVSEKIKDLERETPKTDEEKAEIQSQISRLTSQIINKSWIIEKTIKFDFDKAEIRRIGTDLESEILSSYGNKLTKIEKAYVNSLLVMDAPHTWYDEEFFDIDDNERVALVRRLSNELGLTDKFDEFIAAKRNIYSDQIFYQLIDLKDEIVDIDEKSKMDRLLDSINISEADIAIADEIFNLNESTGEISLEESPETTVAAA